MLMSPETFIENNKNKSYEELLSVRDELMAEIMRFEAGNISECENEILPDPSFEYEMNLKYLGELCELISKKYVQRYL